MELRGCICGKKWVDTGLVELIRCNHIWVKVLP